jgi:hypothetical protein
MCRILATWIVSLHKLSGKEQTRYCVRQFRQTVNPGEFEIAMPIYETAIRLADSRPHYQNDTSATSVRFALAQEFEAALAQFDGNDVSDIDRIFDWL